MKNKKLKIGKYLRLASVILILGTVSYTSFTAFADTYTTQYDSDTIDLQVTNNTYQDISVTCQPGGNNILTMVTPAGTNLRAVDGERYGYNIYDNRCIVTFHHNDPNAQAAIYYEKDYDENLTNQAETDTIDSVGSDCYIDDSGNDDTNEELGFYLRDVIVNADFTVPTDPDTQCSGKTYKESSCGPTTDRPCLHDLEYADILIGNDPDKLIEKTSTTSGVCFNEQCYFSIQVHANITWDTIPGVYDKTTKSASFPTTFTINTNP
jgi:hypothetical protein